MAKKIKAEDGKVYVEKKPFYKRVWFIVLAVIVVIGVFASMGGSDDSKEATSKSTTTSKATTTDSSSKATTTDSSSKASSEETVYSVGQTFTVGDVEYTVNSVSTTQTVGDEFLNETAQGIYLLLNVTIKNNGDDALSVSNDYFTLYKGKTKYTSDSTASLYASDNSGFFLEEVNPGNALTSNVAFDIPQDVVSDPALQLQVQTGFWGTQTAMVNIN
ncbi:DUF4352 domain-containing protein [Streptococcus infantarius]|uniref:DUF4352 domain-containing protein n=1 Tax=Streptococcus infantarius TaxID=102684 RepID=UPI0033778A85|nr:Telomeric repeat-binding factor 2 [Streptococcus infantarius subsp. infantarius]